jgi:hypothetical protein
MKQAYRQPMYQQTTYSFGDVHWRHSLMREVSRANGCPRSPDQ